MAESRTELTNPPRRLPHVRLPGGDQGEVPIIWRRTAPILLFLHPEGCAVCSAFVERVAGYSEAIAEWDGRVLVVVPGSPITALSGSMAEGSPFPILVDHDDKFRSALRVPVPAVVIADQWGEIYERIEAGGTHSFPEPQELVDWSRVIATKCPECEGEVF